MPTTQRGRYRDAVRSGDFRTLLASALVDGLGSWTYSVVLMVVVFDRTHSGLWLSAVSAARWVPGLLAGSYAGVIADRYERTRVMVVSALASTVVMAGIAVAVATAAPVWTLLVGSVLSALAASPYQPAAGALVPEVVGERDLTAANAMLSMVETLVVVLGPALGGALLLTGRPVVGIAFNSASFVVALVLVLRLSVRSRGDASRGEPVVDVWLAGVRALAGQRTALTLVIFCALDTMIYGASSVLYAPLSVRLGTGTKGYSYLLAASALGSVIAAGLANRLATARRLGAVIVGSIILQAAPFAVTAATRSAGVAAGLQVVSGVGMVIVDILAVTALQRDLARGVLSRVLGVFGALSTGACLVGSVVAAALLSATGIETTLILVGAVSSALALAGLPILLAGDRRQARAAAALAERVDVLAGLDLFTGAGRNVLERLAGAAEECSEPAAHQLIRQGDAADALWILLTGSLAVSSTGPDGLVRQLPEVVAPAYVGELGLVRRMPRTADVVTREPCRLLRIDGDAFLSAVESAPLSTSFVQLSSVRLERTAMA